MKNMQFLALCSLLTSLAAAPASGPGNVASFPNTTFIQNNNPGTYSTGIDASVMRSNEPALSLASIKPLPGGASVFRGADPIPYRGKRIRFSAFVKTKEITDWAGLRFTAFGDAGHVLINDDMCDRYVTGTTDWRKLEIVVDVPEATKTIQLGVLQFGPGQLWLDGAQIEVVPDDTPATDDRAWHLWSMNGPRYTAALDPAMQRNGHATMCISSTAGGAWAWWGQCDRAPGKYQGKTLRMTVWIKTEQVTRVTPNLRPKGANFQVLVNKNLGNRAINGTTDWQKYELVADIPAETQCIDSGVYFGGKGKVWFDDFQYEILDAVRVAP